MRLLLIFLFTGFVILNTSVAQIRYAMTNPEQFANLVVNLIIALSVFIILFYVKRGNYKKTPQYNLIGSKGGKSSGKSKS